MGVARDVMQGASRHLVVTKYLYQVAYNRNIFIVYTVAPVLQGTAVPFCPRGHLSYPPRWVATKVDTGPYTDL